MKKMMSPSAVAMVAILVFLGTFWGAPAPAFSGQQSGPAVQQERPAQENLSASAALTAGVAEQQKTEAGRADYKQVVDDVVVKTYSLKYIGWREVAEAAKLYVYASSGSDNTITVRLPKPYIADFEALLKKLDVEKRNIMFRVYTIIASRDNPPEVFKKPETTEIDNRELKSVLDELKGLWNFKHYWVDAPSFLTVRDGSEANRFKLVSDSFDFAMALHRVRAVGEQSGNRAIAVGEIRLDQGFNGPKGPDTANLIDTNEISLKEKGYLVVGVSGLEHAPTGLALILVISAEVK